MTELFAHRNPLPVPRSLFGNMAWPAIPAPGPAMLLALQSQLDDSQWWPAERLEHHQQSQLMQLLDHASRTIPFYGARLAAAGYSPYLASENFADFWRRVPVLRRHEIQASPGLIRSTSPPASHGAVKSVTTSGTTATPLEVAKSQLEQLIWQAITLREERWHRRDWQTTIAIIRRFGDARYREPDGVHSDDWGTPLADVYPTGPAVALDISASVAQQAAWLVRHAPAYLLTEAFNLRRLAEHFHKNGIALPSLREVRAIGGVVDETLRALCRDAWNVEIADIYSCTEAGYLAIQCPEQGGLHIQMEAVLLEVLDARGHPCAPGEEGDVAITTLHNFATPFIRYAIGDRAVMGTPCPCGRGLPTLARIVGRTPRAS